MNVHGRGKTEATVETSQCPSSSSSSAAAFTGTAGVVRVNETYKYSEFRFRREEKFRVLPLEVRVHIENVLLGWLLKNPEDPTLSGEHAGHVTHRVGSRGTPRAHGLG